MGRLRDWLHGAETRPGTGDVVTLTLGTDLHRANLIVEACRAQGLHVELLSSEMGAHPHTPGVEHRILVRAVDVDAVRAVIAQQDGST